jgi:hypothetical protein
VAQQQVPRADAPGQAQTEGEVPFAESCLSQPDIHLRHPRFSFRLGSFLSLSLTDRRIQTRSPPGGSGVVALAQAYRRTALELLTQQKPNPRRHEVTRLSDGRIRKTRRDRNFQRQPTRQTV